MDEYRDLVQARSKGSAGKHKAPNAVEQQKARDKEIKAALKEQKASSAAKKHDEDEARKRTIKEERLFAEKKGRRAREDARKEAHRGDKQARELCEHGIHKCRICHPASGKVDHRAVAAAVRGSLDDSDGF